MIWRQHCLVPNTWFSRTRGINTVDNFVAYFSPLCEEQARGQRLIVIAEHRETGEPLAMSTYQYPSKDFGRVEIGLTWIADKWHRTFVNTEMKHLMLTHAFDVMKTKRVEFSVHPTNEKSNASMKRIGAAFEGTLRKWRALGGTDDGNRNIYSIIDDEWPSVKSHIEHLLR